MSTARRFVHSLVDCGQAARMWKFDMVDAYKNIPAATSDYRLQGMEWLGKYFIETQQAFGSKAAVAAFDRLGNTIACIALIDSQLPPHLMHRTLDDVPIVTPSSWDNGVRFAEAYTYICSKVGISLAPDCPNCDKAFKDSTYGTILGITFNTVTQQWFLSPKKLQLLLKRLAGPLAGDRLSITEMQQLMGSLNDFGQMCPLLKAFRLPLILHLTSYDERPGDLRSLTHQAIIDLRTWTAVAVSAEKGLPIPHRPICPPPPTHSALFRMQPGLRTYVSTTKNNQSALPTTKVWPPSTALQQDRSGSVLD